MIGGTINIPIISATGEKAPSITGTSVVLKSGTFNKLLKGIDYMKKVVISDFKFSTVLVSPYIPVFMVNAARNRITWYARNPSNGILYLVALTSAEEISTSS